MRTGLFQMRTTSDDALRRGAYVAAGYPGDKSDATMWISSGSINDVTPDLLLFRFNVTFGNSGGPIWEQTANGYEAVGLVEGSTSDTNVGVRASEQVTRTFRRWSGTSPEAPGSVNGAHRRSPRHHRRCRCNPRR